MCNPHSTTAAALALSLGVGAELEWESLVVGEEPGLDPGVHG
eukprot:CAMPEP_0195047016 /NCGR_PEP_ID=MMETSP0347-20130606/31683_1 /TAXON_ID=2932 /ORGANISM="Alexandrium fundyense, Strain CCMP1719" /LENGTH=41 /DNA_ID= /DNA_START= /DNA_END= /DNA_ORIENTATION=